MLYRGGNDGVGGSGKFMRWGLLVVVATIAVAALSSCTVHDIRRFFAVSEPTPAPIVVVIMATPSDTPTGTSTPTPTLTPTGTNTPVLALVPTSTATYTPRLVITATLRPTFAPTATKTPTPTATGTSTSTPTTTPTITPTAFVCGYTEMVLMGAGKKHKHCHTPTPEGNIAPRHTSTPVSTGAATPIPLHTLTPIPTSTPTVQPFSVVVVSVSTNTPTVVRTPIATNTPRLVVVPIRSNSPTATATNIPVLAYTPTSETKSAVGSSPHLRHIEEKRYMLELINEARDNAGVPHIELGDNNAAQLHVEAALENCFFSHWGIDGLKPYMRYSLAGGYQSNGENGIGGLCLKASDGYAALRSARWGVERAMRGLMGSPPHRGNILNKRHKKVNIGIAYDRYNIEIAQHFEGDYIEYDVLPVIVGGMLSFSGKTKNGVRFDEKEYMSVDLYYDPPPHTLTREDIAQTYAYCYGLKVAGFLKPIPRGWSYPSDKFDSDYTPCPGDPYGSNYENVKGHYVIATEWVAGGTSFALKGDISKVLDKYGKGVYSVMVWGDIDGERAVISEYSIFHGITPPDTYTPR